jgi:hypothetical protein
MIDAVTARNKPLQGILDPSDALEKARQKSRELYRQLHNWRKVGAAMGVTGGMAWRLANEAGYEPTDNHYRVILGLGALVPTPTCPKCGVVHIRRFCPRPKPNGAVRRVAIRVDNMKSAAGTIFRNVDPEQIKELVGILSNGHTEKAG